MRALLGDFPADREAWREALPVLTKEVDAGLAGRDIEALIDVPQTGEEKWKVVQETLMNLMPPSYNVSADLYALVTLSMVDICLKYGHNGISCFAYMSYGTLLAVGRRDYETAHRFGELALKLSEKYGGDNLRQKILHLFGCFISPWRRRAEESMDHLRGSFRHGYESGDLVFPGFAVMVLSVHVAVCPDDPGAVLEELGGYARFLSRSRQEQPLAVLQTSRQLLKCLAGKTRGPASLDDDEFDEAGFLDSIGQKGHITALSWFHIVKLRLAFLQGELEEAVRHAEEAAGTLPAVAGTYWVTEYEFYRSLALASQGALREARRCYGVLAANCPENFRHRYLLLAAEQARVSGNAGRAVALYEQAIMQARQSGHVCDEALANELAAAFLSRFGGGELQTKEAIRLYESVGACGKSESLRKKKGYAASAPLTISQNLDLHSVLEASQALSSEIILDRLMDILIENAGATNGRLALLRDGRFYLEAFHQDSTSGRIGGQWPLEGSELIPLSVVNYVAHTKKPVMVNNASKEGAFTNDEYVKRKSPRSLLCAPLLSQGRLFGVIYLDNGLISGAFTPERLEMVRLLSQQAAIALENAILFGKQKRQAESFSRFVPREFLDYLNRKSVEEVRRGLVVVRCAAGIRSWGSSRSCSPTSGTSQG